MKTNLTMMLVLAFAFFVEAKENNQKPRKTVVSNIQISNCLPSSAQTNLDIANVRTRIFINGDMWWDLVGTAGYEIPKGSGKTSFFAGAIWIGGLSNGTTLTMAAQTYRQSGSDFWPGPLDTVATDVTMAVCNQYDRHWRVTRQEISDFISFGTTTPDILSWPGNGDPSNNQSHFLAPFVDVNADGIYDPAMGDYPGYDFSGSGDCCNHLQGDQTLWWVFNDMGNIHDETGGNSFGIEVQAQAFAYSSTIAHLSNSTFYSYKIINRSAQVLNETYFGQWIDPDLGNFNDDFVGCDVGRGMGYCYNGDPDDDGVSGYGLNPPAVGVDFLKGPLADLQDGIDNDRDSLIDEPGEEIIMSRFINYHNDFTVIGNPTNANEYYNYLKGIWKDGSPITYGITGHGGTDTCNFMFPGSSDPYGWGTQGVPHAAWSESTAGLTPGDRRFLQSAGPFTFQPGAVQCIITTAIWARAAAGGPQASLDLLDTADDEIQQFFNTCFTVYPTATEDMTGQNISVFPNPSHGDVVFRLPSHKSKHTSLEFALYDMSGRQVRLQDDITSENFLMKRENLRSGVYYYTFTSNGRKPVNGKLVLID